MQLSLFGSCMGASVTGNHTKMLQTQRVNQLNLNGNTLDFPKVVQPLSFRFEVNQLTQDNGQISGTSIHDVVHSLKLTSGALCQPCRNPTLP